MTIKFWDDNNLLCTFKKKFIILNVWNYYFKLRMCFKISKFQKIFYCMQMGDNVHDVFENE
jgi:hypothetical protein